MDPAVHYTLRLLVFQFFRDIDPIQAEFADTELSLLYAYDEAPIEAELLHVQQSAQSSFSLTDEDIDNFIQGPCEDLTRPCVREEADVITFPLKNVRATVREPFTLRCENPIPERGSDEGQVDSS